MSEVLKRWGIPVSPKVYDLTDVARLDLPRGAADQRSRSDFPKDKYKEDSERFNKENLKKFHTGELLHPKQAEWNEFRNEYAGDKKALEVLDRLQERFWADRIKPKSGDVEI